MLIRREADVVRTVKYLCVLFCFLVTPHAFAYRVGFSATANGKAAEGASVCFYPAGSDNNAIAEMFSSRESRCWPASQILDVPPGRWNIYATAPGLVSERTVLLTYEGVAAPERGYHELQFSLLPAATLDFSAALANGSPTDYGVAYLPATASALPATGKQVAVPAGVDVIPMIVRANQPQLIGDVMHLVAGKTAAAVFSEPSKSTYTLVAWLHVNRELAEVVAARKFPPALVQVTDSAGSTHQPIGEPIPHHGLIIVRDLPIGPTKLTIDSDFWTKNQLTVTPASGTRVAVLDTPLETAPAAAIDVNWNVDAAATENLRVSCNETTHGDDSRRLPAVHIRLLSCPGVQPGVEARTVDAAACKEVRTFETKEFLPSGSTTFRGVPPAAISSN